ncbi:tyrosine-protein phosphatase [Leifsonia poae]|uniref:tyrosine-protein phosphatase n=1 Tax=Leifsonia poae TaxID=110933 RepID=UPI001CBFE70A|nr:tyrosine-protein phosphatase [Leifsonia poae]
MSVLEVTHNSRDLGGMPLADGAVFTSRRVFRSDALSTLTESGQEALAALGIGTVIDLRTAGEQGRAPDALAAAPSVELRSVSIQGGAMDELVKQLLPSEPGATLTADQITALVEQIPTLEELYVAILASSAPSFAEVARAVLDAERSDRPGVLIHCTAGKDRTGLAAALLLSVAGAARDDVVADYVLTETNLANGLGRELTALLTSLGVPLVPRLETLATKSPATAIEAALDWVGDTHGDAAGYLRSGGLSETETARLRALLRDTSIQD